ncbi:MAG: transcriptional regulator [Acidobacteriota bacterium]
MAELLVNEPDNEPMAEREFWLGDCFIQPQLNRISRGTESFQIEPKIMRVLLCLAGRAGQLVTRDQLLSAVWGDVFVSEQVLSRSISELRKVLADDARSQTVIETIPKTGYRLIAAISFKPPQTDTTPEDISVPVAPPQMILCLRRLSRFPAFVSAIAAVWSPLQRRGVLALALLLSVRRPGFCWPSGYGCGPRNRRADTTMRLSLSFLRPSRPNLICFRHSGCRQTEGDWCTWADAKAAISSLCERSIN